jgi:hypothetical protein
MLFITFANLIYLLVEMKKNTEMSSIDEIRGTIRLRNKTA